jgi:large subunit ribosomal protein L17
MLSNLAMSILDKERVATTLAKAKEVRGVVERMITYGKNGGLHARRLAACRINNDAVLKKLFDDIAPGYKERNGGYTRILKTEVRKGDCAPMAIIELVGRGHNDAVRKKGGAAKKKAARPKTVTPAADKVAESQTAAPVEDAVDKD